MKCTAKGCKYCDPSREQWLQNWAGDNESFYSEYFAHRGTEVKRFDFQAVAGDGTVGGTNEEGGTNFLEALRASGRIK